MSDDGVDRARQHEVEEGRPVGAASGFDERARSGPELEFYGGEWVSFLPFVIFLGMIVVTTLWWSSISDGALWVPAFVAILVPFFLARDKSRFADVVVRGMASREAIIPVVAWIFAGVFSRVLRDTGLADALAGVATSMHVGPTIFLVVTFVVSALFATASGTGFGTIATGMAVLYPAGVLLGAHPGLLAGAVISGAAFGDNLAPVSDTTIVSATTQGVDVPGVVRSRFKYAMTASALTIAALLVLPLWFHGAAQGVAEGQQNLVPLVLLLSVAVTIWVALRSGDIVIATSWGIVLTAVTAIAVGLMDVVQIDMPDAAKPALLTVSGEGLDREVGGVIYTGIDSMLQVAVLALLLFGSIAVMRAGRGDVRLLNALESVARGPRSAEFTIAAMITALSAVMGLNAPAILATGASFAKPLGQRFGISPYRIANLMDAISCTLVYSLPWTPAVIFTISFARDTSAPLAATDATPFVVYAYAMMAVMIASILLGVGRGDNIAHAVAAMEERGEPVPEVYRRILAGASRRDAVTAVHGDRG